jgi:UDP-N-acetylmuramoyl-L-alanyl-D-glutamate--2,6-diaminopimelate ligase
MIDYAHSPESLQSILSAVKSYTRGKVISVFGCGGDRDKAKRPIMGQISTSIADFSIITSDNPRTEEPEAIVKEIEAGAVKTKGKYITIVDRTEAIKHAIEMATKNDIIVIVLLFT